MVRSLTQPASKSTSTNGLMTVACGRKATSGRTRFPRLLAVCAAALSNLMLAPIPGPAQSPPVQSPPPQSATPAAASIATAMFGAEIGADTDAESVARDGIRWVRTTADWSLIEPSRGKFDWTNLDKTVDRAAAAGLRLVVVLANTPRWAAIDRDTPEIIWRHQPPSDLADWQRFVGQAAARYRGRVAAWQITPMLEFAVFRGTVSDYLGMLRTARLAIRPADPDALVVATSPRGLDLSYVKAMLVRPIEEFDALMLVPSGRTPEEVIEALSAVRNRVTIDSRRRLWLSDGDAGGPKATPDDAVGDFMVRMAAVGVAGGVTRQFWSGREMAARWAAVRQTLMTKLDGARFVGWLPRGPGVYAFVMTTEQTPISVVWSTSEPRNLPLATEGGLTGLTEKGEPASVPIAADKKSVTAGSSPVFVLGIAPAVVEEAVQAAQKGPFRPMRDPAHDFTNADSVSVTLGATNAERGLYNQRFRSLPPGAVVPVTIDGVEAVRTDPPKEVLYVYLDVDHSYAYFLDGQQDILITVEVHRAKAAQQAGFNILYDSATGYRFTSWQWIEPGAGWASYTIRLTDAGFSSTWGWDFAINAGGTKKEPLIVRSVTVRKVRRGARGQADGALGSDRGKNASLTTVPAAVVRSSRSDKARMILTP